MTTNGPALPASVRFEVPVDVGGVDAVNAILDAPGDSNVLFVLGHGAGAGMEHSHMQAITSALNNRGFAVLRYQFPYQELGKNRTDPVEVCTGVITRVVRAAAERCAGHALVLAGHSFGGRMSSHAVVDQALPGVRALVFFSFPLHMKKRSIARAEHLPRITQPLLFLSGSRDTMANEDLMQEALAPVPDATLYWLHTADHSYKILKRTRAPGEDVYDEAARVAHEWLQSKKIAAA